MPREMQPDSVSTTHREGSVTKLARFQDDQGSKSSLELPKSKGLPNALETVELEVQSDSEDSFSNKFEKRANDVGPLEGGDHTPSCDPKLSDDSKGPPDSSDEEAKGEELKEEPKKGKKKKAKTDDNTILASLNEQMAGLGKLVQKNPDAKATDAAQFDVFDLMKKGSPIMKHGNFYNQFDFRMFKLTEDRSAIVWTKKSTMQKLTIEIAKLHEIVAGQQSKTFKKSPKPEVADLSFSIRYKYEKGGKTFVTTLDLICCRKFDREVWMAGLQALMEDPGRKSLPLMVPEQATEDVTGQSMLKRSGAATAARYTGAVGTTVLFWPVGIPMIFWATYTHNRDSKKLCLRRLKLVKELMGKIGKILVRLEVKNHPYTETAKEKYLYIGTLYEEALNIKTETEANNQMRTAHAVQCLAEAQALYLFIKIESDQMKKNEKAKDKAAAKKKSKKTKK